MSFKKIRIAVCLYGQPRTGIYTAPWIRECFNIPAGTEINIYSKPFDSYHPLLQRQQCEVEVDYFFNVKDYNIYFNTKGDPEWDQIRPIPVSESDLQQLVNLYQPRAYEVSSTDSERNLINGERNGYTAMYYSISRAMRLKRQYEINNDINYDFCFAHRFDTMIGPYVTSFRDRLSGPGFNPLSILASSDILRWRWEMWRTGPSDVFFGGDNVAMEMLMADISRLWSSDDLIQLNDELGGPNVTMHRSAGNASVKLDYDHNIISAVVRHSADLSIPVFDSWQYHQQFWLSNHKSQDL